MARQYVIYFYKCVILVIFVFLGGNLTLQGMWILLGSLATFSLYFFIQIIVIDLFTDTAAILNSEEIMGCPGGR